MARDITSAAKTASEASVVRPFWMVFFDFPDLATRVTTLPLGQDITFNGFEWRALGSLGSISSSKETSDLSDADISFTLDGVINNTISVALNLYYQGRTYDVYLAFMDEGHNLIADPTLVNSGVIDNMDITIGKSSVVELFGRSYLSRLSVPTDIRYNNETHQRFYNGDKFFEFTEQSARREIRWGSAIMRNGSPAIVN